MTAKGQCTKSRRSSPPRGCKSRGAGGRLRGQRERGGKVNTINKRTVGLQDMIARGAAPPRAIAIAPLLHEYQTTYLDIGRALRIVDDDVLVARAELIWSEMMDEVSEAAEWPRYGDGADFFITMIEAILTPMTMRQRDDRRAASLRGSVQFALQLAGHRGLIGALTKARAIGDLCKHIKTKARFHQPAAAARW